MSADYNAYGTFNLLRISEKRSEVIITLEKIKQAWTVQSVQAWFILVA